MSIAIETLMATMDVIDGERRIYVERLPDYVMFTHEFFANADANVVRLSTDEKQVDFYFANGHAAYDLEWSGIGNILVQGHLRTWEPA